MLYNNHNHTMNQKNPSLQGKITVA